MAAIHKKVHPTGFDPEVLGGFFLCAVLMQILFKPLHRVD